MKFTTPLSAISIAVLAACGGTTTPNPGPDPVTPPTFSESSLASYVSRNDTFAAVPRTTVVYTGTGVYSGGFYAPMTLNGVRGTALVGDIDLTATFGTTGTVAGNINNVNFVNNTGVPSETLSGALPFNGALRTGNVLDATARGALTGNFGGTTRGTVDMTVDLDGGLRRSGSSFYFAGDVEGSGSGAQDISFDGDFHMRRTDR